MPNSQDFDSVSDPTLARLLDVDAELAAQEAPLLVQLQELQEKRRSLKTVISLFTPDDAAAPADTPEAVSLPLPTETVLEAAAPKAKRPRASYKRTQGKQRALSKPSVSRESWRPYVREELPATATLPELTSKVLHHLPERVFSVPELMSAIFVEKIPPAAYKTARSRLLALLSKGVKEQQWYRSVKGQYRSSGGATEAAVDAPETNLESEIDDQQL